MTHIIKEEEVVVESSWKTQLQERFMKSLDVMLQGAHIAYENKLATLPSTAHAARYQLQIEYNQIGRAHV